MRELSKLNSILRNYDSLYLLDLSWHMYRNYYTFRNFSIDIDGYKQPTGHYYGLVKTIMYILSDDPNACVIIAQDGIPVERSKIMSEGGFEYKEGRPDREYDFYKDIKKIKAILCAIPNVYWAYNEDKESDDQMYALAKQACMCEGFEGQVYIYSGDNDLLQSIDDRISIIRNRECKKFLKITNEELTTSEEFVKKFHGVDSKHIVDYRVIIGDSSDKIPGIPRFPRDIAVKIAMDKNWKPESDKETKWLRIYEENKDLIDRNYSLMKLDCDYTVNLSKPNVNKEALASLLERLKLKSCIDWMINKGYL